MVLLGANVTHPFKLELVFTYACITNRILTVPDLTHDLHKPSDKVSLCHHDKNGWSHNSIMPPHQYSKPSTCLQLLLDTYQHTKL